MVAQTGSTEPFLKAYGFSYDDIRSWGGSIGSMEHTARDAKERRDRGELDAFFGDGSAYDFSAWRWVAEHGYRFLDLREDIMTRLESELGLRRITTPVGFFPGITTNLISAGRFAHRCELPRAAGRRAGLQPGQGDRPEEARYRAVLHSDGLRAARGPTDHRADLLDLPHWPDRSSMGRKDHRRAAA